MAAKPVREYFGKQLLAKYLGEASGGEFEFEGRGMLVKSGASDPASPSSWAALLAAHPWARDARLVAKPDQLIKRRGKAGLLAIDKSFERRRRRRGDVDAKAKRLQVPLGESAAPDALAAALLDGVPEARKPKLARFLATLLGVYRQLHFVYMEINPIVFEEGGKITPLDLAAKLDETAAFLVQNKWGPGVDFPAPFGRAEFPEEAYIRSMDAKTGASLKLTILNVAGRVWTMVAGGGASVVYADTICDLGFAHELANYGEYSGAPNDEQTYNYARTILGLMTRTRRDDGKVLIVGGGIANFTDVAATFRGLIKACGPSGRAQGRGVKIYDAVAPCAIALGLKAEDSLPDFDPDAESKVATVADGAADATILKRSFSSGSLTQFDATLSSMASVQQRAVQGMLDFDFMCKRKKPSVAAMVYPFQGNHYVKFYWGTEETLVPVYTSIAEAASKHGDASCLVNFASYRSVYDTCMETFKLSAQIRTVAIIAEGVPEAQTRDIAAAAERPASASSAPRPVAIGGDRYPGRFIDHLLRYNDNPDCQILVLLGEVGGVDEYDVCAALESGRIDKPLVAWCIGTCASAFSFEVQFGHAGACARGLGEAAVDKNAALAKAGAVVPRSFAEFGARLSEVYALLVDRGTIVPRPEPEVPKVPMDYTWAKRLGMVRKPANFISTISDDRGEELTYGGMRISDVFKEDLGVGGVLSLLWFKRLPPYATKFIEMIPTTGSSRHNTIVSTRAGKDLVSSLVSGLLTIGPRFGGALDGAATMMTDACDRGMSGKQFVDDCKREGKLIMGIGHRIKSVENPDMRVEIIKKYAQAHFPKTPTLDFALEVEAVTTAKRSTLILNVDGCIAVCFVDLLRHCGAMTVEEADELIANGCLNGLFVLGRSLGFIGHHLDQKRLKQPLYRHPWDDIPTSAATAAPPPADNPSRALGPRGEAHGGDEDDGLVVARRHVRARGVALHVEVAAHARRALGGAVEHAVRPGGQPLRRVGAAPQAPRDLERRREVAVGRREAAERVARA
ncbi:ATP citrate synthase [Aureococcus anophagefferens]|nr:ATP citrate synthase [Aureococcus anophagefferens]